VVVALFLTGLAAAGLLLALLLGAGVVRVLWLAARSLWLERNIALLVLLILAYGMALSEPTMRSVIGPLLIGLLIGWGAWQTLREIVPSVLDAWPRQPLLLRLALLGAFFDLAFSLRSLLWG
jgi:hypothetical protein